MKTHAVNIAIPLNMLLNGLWACVILPTSYMFAFWSFPFMGDAASDYPIRLILISVTLLAGINIFSVWRFKKLNAHFSAASGWETARWIYQGLYVALIAGANVLVGFVGVFYLMRLLSEPLA
ncbi:MAG: hypothetical protein HWE12_07815 [Oceanospirillaceae bacterium]|nr:hypothetical protein [Oceanospirillaceae bacterium]